MKRFILSMISLVAVLTLVTVQSYFLTVYATSKPISGRTVSKPTATKVVNVKINGTATIWSDIVGSTRPDQKPHPLHTLAKLVQDPSKDIWSITMTNLSIPWNGGTALTIQKGQAASGTFRPSTNAVSVILPLQHVPVVNTIKFNLSTDGSITTATGQIIRGSRVDRKGNITLIGSMSQTVLLFVYHVQVRVQGTLSPWPLRTTPPVHATQPVHATPSAHATQPVHATPPAKKLL
jgi:hypothetical protein